MKTLDQITLALGLPRAVRTIRCGSRPVAAIARWSHDGACIDLNGSDAYQVVFNVSGGQIVEFHSEKEQVSHRRIRAGSIGLNAPEQRGKLTVRGPADTLHILLTPEWIESVSGEAHKRALPDLALWGAELRAAAAQALVALERPLGKGTQSTEAILRTVAHHFSAPALLPRGPSIGGLSPGARRRVITLIEKRIRDSSQSSPKLNELASAAGLSVHHFIKTFRHTEGQTPHARLLSLRLEHALDLMLGSNVRVDQASEETGFSSPSHFVNVFRKHLGVTPGALRDAALMRH